MPLSPHFLRSTAATPRRAVKAAFIERTTAGRPVRPRREGRASTEQAASSRSRTRRRRRIFPERVSGRAAAAGCEFIHFACTSEDINNLSHALMLGEARTADVLLPALDAADRRALRPGPRARRRCRCCRARTASRRRRRRSARNSRTSSRGSKARAARRGIRSRARSTARSATTTRTCRPTRTSTGPFSRAAFVEGLGLEFNAYTTQIEPHDGIAEYCDALAAVNTILIDLDRDLWGYISLGYFKQRSLPAKSARRRCRTRSTRSTSRTRKATSARERAAAHLADQAAGLALAARPHRLDGAAQPRRRPSATRCSPGIPAARPAQARSRTDAHHRRSERQLGSARRADPDRDASLRRTGGLREAEGTHARPGAPLFWY
jgi:hypothetical protein